MRTCLGLLLCVTGVQAQSVLESRPLEQFNRTGTARVDFGRLTLLGGLLITDTRFKGIGGFHIGQDGHTYLAVDEEGNWFRGQLLCAESGAPLKMTVQASGSFGDRQLEAVTVGQEYAYLSLEDPHCIQRCSADIASNLLQTPELTASASCLTDDLKQLPPNEGVEALVLLDTHRLLVIPEGHRGETRLHSYLVDPSRGTFERLTIRRSAEYDVSDAAPMPNGDVLLLERNVQRRLRLRLLESRSIHPGADLQGETWLELDGQDFLIPPFEALSVHTQAGATYLTLLSDNGDRRSLRHATRLLRFGVRRRAVADQ